MEAVRDPWSLDDCCFWQACLTFAYPEPETCPTSEFIEACESAGAHPLDAAISYALFCLIVGGTLLFLWNMYQWGHHTAPIGRHHVPSRDGIIADDEIIPVRAFFAE